MSYSEYKRDICAEIDRVLTGIDHKELMNFVESCKNAQRIMLIGKGRVGQAMKAFSIRMNAMGKHSCFLDETTSFHMTQSDLLVIGNMSGDSKWAGYYVDVAHHMGISTFYMTSLDGEASDSADGVLHIRARAYGVAGQNNYTSCQPMSSTAEQCLWLVLDAASYLLADTAGGDRISTILASISRDVQKNIFAVDEDEIDGLISSVEGHAAKCFFGRNRLGIILYSFGMRIAHMGYDVHIYGETGWRMPRKGDILIACISPDYVRVLQSADDITVESGLYGLCAMQNSVQEEMGAVVLHIPNACSVRDLPECALEAPFSEDAFCHALYVILDYIVCKMMESHNWTESVLSQRHANIQ